jgi:hypothetical protein
VAVILSLSLWPIKAADTLVMDNGAQIVTQLTYLEDQKLLTLR